MSYTSSYTLLCDTRGCDKHLKGLVNIKAHALRMIARDKGWACGPHGDFCPNHRKRKFLGRQRTKG